VVSRGHLYFGDACPSRVQDVTVTLTQRRPSESALAVHACTTVIELLKLVYGMPSTALLQDAILEDNRAHVQEMARKVFYGSERVDTSKFIERCHVRLLEARRADYGIPTDWQTLGKAGGLRFVVHVYCQLYQLSHVGSGRYATLCYAMPLRCLRFANLPLLRKRRMTSRQLHVMLCRGGGEDLLQVL
jgi:hypothetical protein